MENNKPAKLAVVTSVTEVRPLLEYENKLKSVTLVNVSKPYIVVKGELKPGDKVVLFSIGSFLPFHPAYDDLLQSYVTSMNRIDSYVVTMNEKKGYRLFSLDPEDNIPGLVVPMRKFDIKQFLEDGTDVTELLEVQPYRKFHECSPQKTDNNTDFPVERHGKFTKTILYSIEQEVFSPDGYKVCAIIALSDKEVWIWAKETEAGGIRIRKTDGQHGERVSEDIVMDKNKVRECYYIYKALNSL